MWFRGGSSGAPKAKNGWLWSGSFPNPLCFLSKPLPPQTLGSLSHQGEAAVSGFTCYEDLGTQAKPFGDWENAGQVAVASRWALEGGSWGSEQLFPSDLRKSRPSVLTCPD